MKVWEFVSIFGEFELWLLIGLILFLIPVMDRRKRKKYYWLALLLPSLFLASFLTFLLKENLKIHRPCIDLPDCPVGYSFPSGHSAVIFSVATIIILNNRKSRFLILLFLSMAIIVSLARVMLNYHRVEDVVFGGVLGILSGLVVNKVSSKKYGEAGI